MVVWVRLTVCVRLLEVEVVLEVVPVRVTLLLTVLLEELVVASRPTRAANGLLGFWECFV